MNLLRSLQSKYINFVDFMYPKGGRIAEAGGVLHLDLSQNEALMDTLKKVRKAFFSQVELVREIEKSPNVAMHLGSVSQKFPGLAEILDQQLVLDITNYLGDGSRFDSMALSAMYCNYSLGEKNTSGVWHHDSVGHRLKFFIPLDETGNVRAPTRYILQSNLFRHNFMDVYRLKGKRIPQEIIENNIAKSKTMSIDFGHAFIFDTNGLHKGEYDDTTCHRLWLQLEFSSYKSIIRGQVGYTQIERNSFFFSKLKSFGLARGRLLVNIFLPVHYALIRKSINRLREWN
jgi:hypothetical protein